jgi:hypothetical protein
MKDRIKMLLTENEARLINDLRQSDSRKKAEHKRHEMRRQIPECKFICNNGTQCPMKAHPEKDGYCGNHYRIIHGLPVGRYQ